MSAFGFAGPDRGRIKEGIDAILHGLERQHGERPDTQSFYVGEDSMEDVVARLRNTSLFSPHLCALVHNADHLNATDLKLFKAWAAHPGDSSTLILIADDPKSAGDKLSFLPKDRLKILYEMSDGEKKGYTSTWLTRQGVPITPEALDLFCDLVSPDTDDIKAQCGLLINSTPPGTPITLETVESFIFHSREENVYTLFESLLEGDLGASLECVHKIIQSQESEPVGIVLGLQWQYRSLADLKEAGIRQPSYDDFRARRIFMKRTQQLYLKALSAFNKDELLSFIDTLSRYDQLVREARAGSHFLLIEMMIYELTQKRRLNLGAPSLSLFGA